VDQQVSQTGAQRFRASAEPNQEHGREGHDLPEQEQGYKIPGVDRANRTRHVHPGGHVLSVFFDVQSVERSEDAHQTHDVTENQAQFVNPAKDQRPIQELHMTENARAERQGCE
jgi:hypothetical protein